MLENKYKNPNKLLSGGMCIYICCHIGSIMEMHLIFQEVAVAKLKFQINTNRNMVNISKHKRYTCTSLVYCQHNLGRSIEQY